MKIPLTNGGFTIVDDDAGPEVTGRSWALHSGGYAVSARYDADAKRSSTLYLARLVLGLKQGDGMQADHISGQKLDNRRVNLRSCTAAQNRQNIGAKPGARSQFKGVFAHRSHRSPWKAEIRANGVVHYLGAFATESDAAVAYDAAALIHHGDFARLNFPTERSSE